MKDVKDGVAHRVNGAAIDIQYDIQILKAVEVYHYLKSSVLHYIGSAF